MNHYIVKDIRLIPDKATFYYLSNEGKQLKCQKKGKWGFSWKPTKNITQYRYTPFDENWDAVVSTRTAKRIWGEHLPF